MSAKSRRAARRRRERQEKVRAGLPWKAAPREIVALGGPPEVVEMGDKGDPAFTARVRKFDLERASAWSKKPKGWQKPGHDPSSPINRDARVAGRDWRPRDEQEAAHYRRQHGTEGAMTMGRPGWGKALDWDDREQHLGYQPRGD